MGAARQRDRLVRGRDDQHSAAPTRPQGGTSLARSSTSATRTWRAGGMNPDGRRGRNHFMQEPIRNAWMYHAASASGRSPGGAKGGLRGRRIEPQDGGATRAQQPQPVEPINGGPGHEPSVKAGRRRLAPREVRPCRWGSGQGLSAYCTQFAPRRPLLRQAERAGRAGGSRGKVDVSPRSRDLPGHHRAPRHRMAEHRTASRACIKRIARPAPAPTRAEPEPARAHQRLRE